MKLHGDWMYECRRGRIAFRWDFYSWGVGIHGGTYFSDWRLVVGMEECYRVAWMEVGLGPFDLEIAGYGPGRKWEEEEWVSLDNLRPGAVFETKDGVVAVKTEYHTFVRGTQCDCYLLENGETAHFHDKDNELVRELSEKDWGG